MAQYGSVMPDRTAVTTELLQALIRNESVNDSTWSRRGQETRRAAMTTIARTPAITARPVAVSTGLKLSSAQTVQGSENEKPTTPSSAMARPCRCLVVVTAAPYSDR